MQELEIMFDRFQKLGHQLRDIGGIVQNPIEPMDKNLLITFAQNMDAYVIEVQKLKLDVLNFFSSSDIAVTLLDLPKSRVKDLQSILYGMINLINALDDDNVMQGSISKINQAIDKLSWGSNQ